MSLPSVVNRAESLVDQLEASLSSDVLREARNSVYLMEDINALALDEVRPLTTAEKDAVHHQLTRLESLTSRGH